MVYFPNCKINLGLHITRKRADGYHDLETVFYPISLNDALEIIPASSFSFQSSGLTIEGDASSNLCVKAYQLLQKDFPQLPPVQMHLHKAIPMGAGLGGGSADGAFALKLLNNRFGLQLSAQQLIDYALQLGSDCPFFIYNQPCFATGRGELMQPISLDLSTYQFVIINPKIHIATGWAFGNIQPKMPTTSIQQIIQQPIETWKEALVNDFEAPAIAAFPEIGSIKQQLYQQNAIYASMTGSGSTVFGIFPKNQSLQLSFPKHYFVFQTQ